VEASFLSALAGVEPAPSSLLSSWWSRDNVITSHPGRLYDGAVLEPVEADSLESLVADLAEQRGSLRAGEGTMSVFSWQFRCEDASGAFVVQIPVALDEPGRGGRAKRDVPRQNFENAKHYLARGLARYVAEPDGVWTLAGGVPAATFRALDGYFPVTFGAGAVHVTLGDGWTVALGPDATAEVLAEVIASLVYHYEPDETGGTALSDVFVNDDFVVKRRRDGSLALRLTAARRREPGIGPNLLLLYLVQLMTYEDFVVGDRLSGQPTLLSNPAVAFDGVVRGLRYRYADTARSQEDAEREARRWIAEFGHSREGRAYRPWVERFLDGRLPLRFGDDPRELWWRLFAPQSKWSLLELRARAEPASAAAQSARELKAFLERLSREMGRAPERDAAWYRVNDLGRDALLSVLAELNVDSASREGVADAFFEHWPYRSLDALLARVPGARGLRRAKSRLSFGRVVAPADRGTLRALGPAPKTAAARVLANPELFNAVAIPLEKQALAVSTFPTFEAYMDAALHDETWGYYSRRVVIADGGHFLTHPEELSPHYGRWIARWAFKVWCDLVSHAEISEDDTFSLIEFGAGNGRLARDVLDAVAAGPGANANERERWRTFAARLEYRIYEISESLRRRQRELLGERAVVAAGDARRPSAALKRDFPDGVRGLVVSNELPDAFGVHKVAMSPEGEACAALVIPRIEPALREALDTALADRTTSANAAIRSAFGFSAHPGDHYLDAATFADVMRAVAELGEEGRESRLSGLWFEEGYVDVSAVPRLAAHLAQNSVEYRAALSAEPSGVVVYVNVHASDYVRELGAVLKAGFVVTIDYGDSTAALVRGARRGDFSFRVYGESRDYVPRPNDPYFAPGTQDLTADVNFTDLARAGQECGLELVHFGPERDIVADELPEVLRAASSAPAFERFLGNPPFKVLVLGTRASQAFASPLMTSLALMLRDG
jgi:SAM-dependent MidA family methyltransferase